MHTNMKIFLCAFTFIFCMYSCKSKMLSEVQHAELIEAIELYKITNGKYPQNKNAFFFQEIIPFIKKRSLFKANDKLLFLNFPNSDPAENFQKIPIHILVDRTGKPIMYNVNAHGNFNFQIDTLPFLSDHYEFKLEFIRSNPYRIYDSNDTTEYYRDLQKSNYYLDQQIFFYKKDIPGLSKSLEVFKQDHQTYPICCSKYFVNFLLLYAEDNVTISLEHDFCILNDKFKVSIYRTSKSDGPFPFLSYCYRDTDKSYSLYYTGKNVIDEMGLGDDVLLQ